MLPYFPLNVIPSGPSNLSVQVEYQKIFVQAHKGSPGKPQSD